MRVRNLTAVGYKCYQRVSFSEDFALLEDPYGVAVTVLGHDFRAIYFHISTIKIALLKKTIKSM